MKDKGVFEEYTLCGWEDDARSTVVFKVRSYVTPNFVMGIPGFSVIVKDMVHDFVYRMKEGISQIIKLYQEMVVGR